MSKHHVDLRTTTDHSQNGMPQRWRPLGRPSLLLTLMLSLLVFSQVLSNWSVLIQPTAYAADVQMAHSTPGSFSFQQYLKTGPQHTQVKKGSPSPYPQPPTSKPNLSGTPMPPVPSAEPPTMKAIIQPLSSAFLSGGPGVSAFDLKGSDGRLEVQLQPGSLDLSRATVSGGKAPNGALTLQVTQISGHFEAVLNQLGTYQVQVVDSQGQVVNGIALRTPLTIIYHYQMSEMLGLNLDPAHILLTWPTLLKAAEQAKQPTSSFVLAMHNDPVAHTLTAQSRVVGFGQFTLHNDGANQMAPSPHLAEMQGNNGQLSYSYPLKVVPGSGGVAPQLELDYSTMDPNGRHSITSPANDEGDGFSISMGAITSEFYPTSNTTWYFISGIDNVSDRLIEYDTTNQLFYTEHLSYLRIQQVTVGGQPCFNVWDKSGTFYEVGCTSDSLEYSMPNGRRENYQWNVDRIIAPSEGPQGTGSAGWRLIKISYLQDCGSTYSPAQTCAANNAPIRDSAIEQITYGYNTSFGSLTSFDGIAGTIDFTYLAPFNYTNGNVNWATAYSYGSTGNDPCTTAPITPTLRCDDPLQETGSGSYFTAPDVLGTLTLASMTSYLNTDSAGNAAYGYNFKYQDTPFYDCIDPTTGLHGYCAGEHVLTRITPIVYQSSTAHTLPATTFNYSPAPGAQGVYTATYYDSIDNGGFAVTTNWQYLTSYQDLNTGIGESMTYSLAYSNTDGTPTIENGQNQVTDDRFDALYCSSNANNPNTSLRCFQGNFPHPDDLAWSTWVVTSITSSGKDSSALSAPTTTYSYYHLAQTGSYVSGAWCHPDQLTPSVENQCVGDNWLVRQTGVEEDWQDYYHAEFRGFDQVWQVSPAGDLTVGYYFSTEGWNKPATDPADYDAGQMFQQEIYQGGSFDPNKLLSRTVNTYPTLSNQTACYTPSGSSSYAACDVMILSSKTTEFDETNSSNSPWVEHDYTYDDYSVSGGFPTCTGQHPTFCGYHNLTQEVMSGANLPTGSPNNIYPLTEKWSYAINDSGSGGTGWIYYNVAHVSHNEVDDHSGHIWECQYTSYDEGDGNNRPGAGLPTTVNTYSSGNCANQTSPTLTTTYQMYDAFGNTVATVDANGAGTPALYNGAGCTPPTGTIEIANSAWNKGKYTSCANYDSGHYYAVPVKTINALGQTTNYAYDNTQGNVLQQSTDPNSQTTSYAYSYDSSGNSTVQITVPPDSSNFTSQTSSYSTCPSVNGLPCYEVDTLSHQYNSNAALSSTFYDSLGRAVETSTPFPAPSGAPPNTNYYTIVYTMYNDGNHSIFKSEPFVVAVSSSTHGSGYIDPNNAQDYLHNTVYGTGTYDDALGRVLAVRDPLFNANQATGLTCSTAPQFAGQNFTACTNYTVGQVGGDSNYYISATSIDPNNHVSVSYLDALGRTVYTQQDSNLYGGVPAPTPNEQTTILYNALDKPTQVKVTDESLQSGQTITSATTTMQYDDLGRLTQLVDPDRGTHNYTLDPNGNVIQDSVGSRTIGYAYDLLNRLGCVQDEPSQQSVAGACGTSSQNNNGQYNAYIQNTYDTNKLTLSGTTDYPIGRLTQSISTTYFSGSAASVTEAYEHDARGRSIGESLQFSLPSSWNVTTALPTYQEQMNYNDADQLTTTQTSAVPSGQGFTTTQVYDPTTGVKTGLSNNGTATADLATLSYNSQSQLSSLNLLTSSSNPLAIDSLGYDGNLRLSSIAASWQSGSGNSGTIFSQNLTYDAASNLISLTTTQNAAGSKSGGTETSNFCYDEQNRLVWAGNSGTQPGAGKGTCGSATLADTISGANYADSYVYTHLGQLWQAPRSGGSAQYQYLYCNTQPHELTGLYAIGSTCSSKSGQGYASVYDAFGNVTTRTTSGTTGTLTYDLLDHFTQWYVSATNQEQYLYDASGQRLLRRVTNSTSTTIITYPFGIEEHQYSGSGTNQANTYYYFLAGHLLGSLDSNGTQFYLTDALGSLISSFTNAQGGARMKSNQVFGPYGNARYTAGNLNTAKGFIGQYNDNTGLDYFNARYYDPVVGVFLSADTVQGNVQGMNPYAYVNSNPETYSDPSGQIITPVHGSGQPTVNVTLPATGPTTFPYWIPPVGALGSGAASTAGVNSAAATSIATGILSSPLLSKNGSDQRQDPLTSCGVPLTQGTCGNFFANYAFYSPLGEIGLPGLLCLICGGSGASDRSGEVSRNSTVVDLATDASGTDGGNPPGGWEIMDYGSDNQAEIVDFTHIDETGNTLEATLYRKLGELQISWMDSLSQAKNHLPTLVSWLGESVQTVKGYISDNFATYFSPQSRGLALVNRMFASTLEQAGFAQGTIELEGSRTWIVFRRIE